MIRPQGSAALFALALLALLALSLSVARDGEAPEPPDGKLRLPANIVFQGGGQGTVVFDHSTHVAFTENDCRPCHIGLFKLLNTTHQTSHREMEAAISCGGCHDGEQASDFKDPDNCSTCHAGREGEVASPDASFSREILIPRGKFSPGPVMFRHLTHQGAEMSCSRCHPDLFPPRAGNTAWTKEIMLTGGSCGDCHDGASAFGVNDSEHCQRCHAEEISP